MDEIELYLVKHEANCPRSDWQLLREIACDRLEDAPRHADIPPGKRLSENRISKVMGTTVTAKVAGDAGAAAAATQLHLESLRKNLLDYLNYN
jgi:DNA-binding GntR family transcriptional regulator